MCLENSVRRRSGGDTASGQECYGWKDRIGSKCIQTCILLEKMELLFVHQNTACPQQFKKFPGSFKISIKQMLWEFGWFEAYLSWGNSKFIFFNTMFKLVCEMIDFLILFSCVDITVLDYIHPYSLPLAIFLMLVSVFFLHILCHS